MTHSLAARVPESSHWYPGEREGKFGVGRGRGGRRTRREGEASVPPGGVQSERSSVRACVVWKGVNKHLYEHSVPGQAAQVPRRLGLGKRRGRLAGARGQVGARRHRESPGGGRGVSRPGGPPGAGGPGSGRGARPSARLPSAPPGRAPGPASRDASLPFRPAPGPRLPGSPRRSPPAPGPSPLPGSPPPPPPRTQPRARNLSIPFSSLGPLLPGSRRLSPPPAPCNNSPSLPAPGSGTSRPRVPRRRVSAAGPQPFPAAAAAAAALSGAARRGAGLASSCGRGEGGRWRGERERGETQRARGTSVRSGDTLPLSVRPGKSSGPRRSPPPREGGWAAAWGGVSRAAAMAATSPGGSPPSAPAPARGRDLCHSGPPQPHPTPGGSLQGASAHARPRNRPGDPSPPVLATRGLPLREASPGPGGRAGGRSSLGPAEGPHPPGGLSRKLAARFPRPLGLWARRRARVCPFGGAAGPRGLLVPVRRGRVKALTSLPEPEKSQKTRSFFWPGRRGRNWELGRAGLQLRGRRGEAGGGARGGPTGAPRSLGADKAEAPPRGNKGPAATGTEAAGTRPAPPTCGRHTLARAQESCGLCPRGAGVFRCQEKATVFPSLCRSGSVSPSPKPAPCFSVLDSDFPV